MAAYRLPDQIGKRFGKLVVLEEIREGRLKCLFRCDCGTEFIKSHGDVKSSVTAGHCPSCWDCCLRGRSERLRQIKRTHGLSKTKLYGVHRQMLQRCYNVRCKDYPAWGGRGIRACDEWRDLRAFIAWALTNGYREGLTIERVNNDGHYEPANCTWIPNAQQCLNTRPRRSRKPCARDRTIEFDGRSLRLGEWCEMVGISRSKLTHRLNRGWSVERALKC